MRERRETVTMTKEELNQVIDSALKRCAHNTPSPETIKMLNVLYDALFGPINIEGKREGGMIEKNELMYEAFMAGSGGIIFLKWTGAVLISLGVIISAIKGFSR